MEENMRELGVKFNCVSLKPISRPICAGNISKKSTKFSSCQEAKKTSRYAPTCSKNYIHEEETCGCSVNEEKPLKSACNQLLYESEDDNENYKNSDWRNESQGKLKKQYKSCRSCPKPEYNRYQTQRKRNSRQECANKHRRNTLRTQLSQLLRKIKPTPENCVPDSRETKPEPEILAEVLLMSELEGADLSSLSPGNIFNKVFAELCDLTSYSSNLKFSQDKEIHNKNDEAISLIEFTGEENMDPSLDDTFSNFNEENHSSTQYKSLPHPKTKNPISGNSEPLGHSSSLEISSENLDQKNHRLAGESECTRVQINGTVKPVWFPGYVVISSMQPNYVRITSNPEAALSEIWRLCRPQNVSPASKLILTYK